MQTLRFKGGKEFNPKHSWKTIPTRLLVPSKEAIPDWVAKGRWDLSCSTVFI